MQKHYAVALFSKSLHLCWLPPPCINWWLSMHSVNISSWLANVKLSGVWLCFSGQKPWQIIATHNSLVFCFKWYNVLQGASCPMCLVYFWVGGSHLAIITSQSVKICARKACHSQLRLMSLHMRIPLQCLQSVRLSRINCTSYFKKER